MNEINLLNNVKGKLSVIGVQYEYAFNDYICIQRINIRLLKFGFSILLLNYQNNLLKILNVESIYF